MTFGLIHKKEILQVLINESRYYHKHKNALKGRNVYLFRYVNNNLYKYFSVRLSSFLEERLDAICKHYLLYEFFSIFSINKSYAEVMYNLSIDNEEEIYKGTINLYNKANHEYLKYLTKSTILTKSFYDMVQFISEYHRYLKNNFISFTNVYNSIISETYSFLLFEDNEIHNNQFLKETDEGIFEINIDLIFDQIKNEIHKSNIFTINETKNALNNYEHVKIINDIYNEFLKNNITTLYVYYLDHLFKIEPNNIMTETPRVFLGYKISLSYNFLDRSLYYICLIYLGFSVKLKNIYKYEPILALCKSFRSNKNDIEIKSYIHNPNFDKVPYSINPRIRNDMFFIKEGQKNLVESNYVISTKNNTTNDIDKRLFYECLYNNKMNVISNILKSTNPT